ncbi:MAG: hypothetical protein GYB53_10305 [Rhodobacteraceae bacterium]|nr:hypothetical protein [Paracoccaceae bacterium]MBR9820701.1 hypothetical protein [Paracoccaceae bacterium]
MAQRARQHTQSGKYVQFPPEADEEFGLVSDSEIASWQEKLNKRFGIGEGRLKVVEEPATAE